VASKEGRAAAVGGFRLPELRGIDATNGAREHARTSVSRPSGMRLCDTMRGAEQRKVRIHNQRMRTGAGLARQKLVHLVHRDVCDDTTSMSESD
jgi:hypothetical protein